MDQVESTYKLIKVLERLRVIGRLKAHTEKAIPLIEIFGHQDVLEIIDMTGNDYCIVKDSYSSDKSQMSADEMIEEIFGRRGVGLRGINS
jgi:hypothetical protein